MPGPSVNQQQAYAWQSQSLYTWDSTASSACTPASSNYWNEGIGATLLACAGYSGPDYVVHGEFAGDLSRDLAACGFPASVGHGRACLVYVRTPQADRHLQRLPRWFKMAGRKVNISRHVILPFE